MGAETGRACLVYPVAVVQDRDIDGPGPERRARARERVLRQAVDDCLLISRHICSRKSHGETNIGST